MGISIRNLCWQAHKPTPIILCKHYLFKKAAKTVELILNRTEWGEGGEGEIEREGE